MSRYKVLLFDADRTLFDFDGAERIAFGKVMRSFGIQYDEDDFIRYRDNNLRLWAMFEQGGITKDELLTRRFDEFLATLDPVPGVDGKTANAAYLEALADGSQLFDGALELCRELSGEYELYIVTNGVSRTQKKRFYASPIRDCFRDIFVSEDAGAPKPMKAYFDYVFSMIGEDKRACSVIIGDSLPNDIKGGNMAGIDTVWYAPDGKINDTDIIPTVTVASYDELAEWLKNS